MGLVVLIDRPGYRLASDAKVIKRSDACIVEQTARAFELAEGQINEALRNAEAACAGIAAEAYEKGLSQAQREAAQRLTVVELNRGALLHSLLPAIAELVVEAVTLIAKGIDRQATLARALELLQGAFRDVSWARLHVHPDVVVDAQAALEALSQETGVGKLARVVADAALPVDGCVLESDSGSVDASLDTQLNAIRDAVLSGARQLVTSQAGSVS
jgi:type III secretion protein L